MGPLEPPGVKSLIWGDNLVGQVGIACFGPVSLTLALVTVVGGWDVLGHLLTLIFTYVRRGSRTEVVSARVRVRVMDIMDSLLYAFIS